jgi:hypothetical protein
MEAWMHFDRVLSDLFQQPGAYPYPFGSAPWADSTRCQTRSYAACPADAYQRRVSRDSQWRGEAIGDGQEVGVALPPAALTPSYRQTRDQPPSPPCLAHCGWCRR